MNKFGERRIGMGFTDFGESRVGIGAGLSDREVDDFHKRDDVDESATSHHHTLGLGAGQAAPGTLVAELIKRIEALEGP